MSPRRSQVVAAGAIVIALLGGTLNLWRLAGAPVHEPRGSIATGAGASSLEPSTEGPGARGGPLHRVLVGASTGLPIASPLLAARIPSAILALLLTLAVYLLAATESRIRCGWLAATALASIPGWLAAARSAEPDMTLTFFVASAVMSFAMIERNGPENAWRLAFWLSTLGGSLIAGPAGLALPLAVIAAHTGGGRSEPGAGLDLPRRRQRMRDTAAALALRAGLPAVLALALLVHGLAGTTARPNLLAPAVLAAGPEVIATGIVSRVSALLAALGPGLLPWCLTAPAVIGWLRQDRPLHGLPRLATVWFGIGLVAFLLAGDPSLLLTCLPAAALLFGLVLGPGPEGTKLRKRATVGWILGTVPPLAVGLSGLSAVLLPGSEAVWLGWLPTTSAARVNEALSVLRAAPVITATASAIAVVGSLLAALQAWGAHWLRASVPLVAALTVLFLGLRVPVEQAETNRRDRAVSEAPASATAAEGR